MTSKCTCEQPCSQYADKAVGMYEPVNLNLTEYREHAVAQKLPVVLRI